MYNVHVLRPGALFGDVMVAHARLCFTLSLVVPSSAAVGRVGLFASFLNSISDPPFSRVLGMSEQDDTGAEGALARISQCWSA